MTKKQIIWLIGLLGALLFLVGSCSGERKQCFVLDVSCDRKALAELTGDETITRGKQIRLDAKGSVYDKIRWFVEGREIEICRDNETCKLIMSEVGIYQFRVDTIVEPFYGIVRLPKSKDSEFLDVEVVLPTDYEQCQEIARNKGGRYVDVEAGFCLIMEREDQVACRSDNYEVCITPEDAQTVCTGDWRLPTPKEWETLRIRTDEHTDANGLCIVDKGICNSAFDYVPNRYILDNTYPNNKGVGSFVEYEFLSIVLLPFNEIFGGSVAQEYRGHVRTSELHKMYSVRCMQKVVLE